MITVIYFSFGMFHARASDFTVGYIPYSSLIGLKLLEEDSLEGVALLQQISQGLVDTDRYGRLVPAIAKSWHISKNGREYTFTIRDDVFFHDGTKLSTIDIIYSFNFHLANTRNLASHLLRDALQCKSGTECSTRIRITGKNTIQFSLPSPYRPLLKLLTSGSKGIIPSKKSGLPYFVGTGPYKVVEKGERLFLQPHSRYKGYYYPKLKFRILSLNDKTAGILPSVFFSFDEPTSESKSKYIITKKFDLNTYHWIINIKKESLNLKAKRLSVVHAIKNSIPESYKSHSERLRNFFPRGMLGHAINQDNYQKYYVKDIDSKLLENRVLTFASWGEHPFKETFKKNLWEKYRIRAEFEEYSPPKAIKKMGRSSADVIFLGWAAPFNDPEAALLGIRILEIFQDRIMTLSINGRALSNKKLRAREYAEINKAFFSNSLFYPFVQRSRFFYWSKSLTYPKMEFQYSIRLSDFEERG
ncbi:MAG: hypothetical protein HRU19_31255 [Pseudobacteriovorax sp.]|nr:hypothetical protein [Pseudobacteriovorax sp.]